MHVVARFPTAKTECIKHWVKKNGMIRLPNYSDALKSVRNGIWTSCRTIQGGIGRVISQ